MAPPQASLVRIQVQYFWFSLPRYASLYFSWSELTTLAITSLKIQSSMQRKVRPIRIDRNISQGGSPLNIKYSMLIVESFYLIKALCSLGTRLPDMQ